jgi:hypothetical protein
MNPRHHIAAHASSPFAAHASMAESGYFGFSSAPAPLAPPAPKRTGPAPSFAELVQIVWDSVHSGSGRTALADNNTDYYPVPLSADTLRPGTVYADPRSWPASESRLLCQVCLLAAINFQVAIQPRLDSESIFAANFHYMCCRRYQGGHLSNKQFNYV